MSQKEKVSYNIPQNLSLGENMNRDLKRVAELTDVKTNDLIRNWIEEKISWYKIKFRKVW